MKRTLRTGITLFTLAALVLVLCLNPFGAETVRPAAPAETETGVFRFPASLLVVGEEAFEGTAVSSAVLQDGTAAVEGRAFAGTPELKEIYIPGSVETIAEDAFEGAGENLTVFGEKNSAAEDWAFRHGRPFIVRDIWAEGPAGRSAPAWLLLLLLAALLPAAADAPEKLRRTAQAVAYIAMACKKRAELFVRDLCFP